MAQRHRKEIATGTDRCASLWSQRAAQINVIARIRRSSVLARCSGKRRPSEPNVESSNVADAPGAASALDMRAGKRILEEMHRFAQPLQSRAAITAAHRTQIEPNESSADESQCRGDCR